MNGRRAAALVLLAGGGLTAAMAWRQMNADPIRAATGAATGVLAVLLNLFVAGGGVVRASRWLRKICVLVGCMASLAAGGAYVYVDRVVGPELEERRERLARSRVPEGAELRESVERLDATKNTLPWIAGGTAVCVLSAIVAPWKVPTTAAGGREPSSEE